MPRAKPDIETKIAEATLRLAAKEGWNSLTLDRIAKAAKVPPAKAQKAFSIKNHILPAIVRHVGRLAEANIGKPDMRASKHDRVFEALMARFDILQEHRKGVLAIFRDCRAEPTVLRYIVPAQAESMRRILAQAGLTPKGLQEHLAIAALLAVHYRALWFWQKDNSPDMARTMAVLDQGLRLTGKAADILFRARSSG